MREVIIRYRDTGDAWPTPLDSAERLARYSFEALQLAYGDIDRETLIVIPASATYQPLCFARIEGAAGNVMAPPETVLGTPLRLGAQNFFMAHCHPSGDPTPSEPDLHVTNVLRNLATVLGLHMCGHLVIASNGMYHSILSHTRGTLDVDAIRAGHVVVPPEEFRAAERAVYDPADRFKMLELDD